MTDIKEETFKANGQGLLPEYINRDLIRKIYLSEDEGLIKLFSENLPIPNIEVFEGHPVPSIVRNRAEQATEAILKFLEKRALKKGKQFDTESEIIGLQREFRAKRRQKEEIVRVLGYEFIKNSKISETEKKEFVERVLADANTPYKPTGCSRLLAERIVSAAARIKLFSTVHHLTSERALENIFNDSLYGRKTLLQSYLPFKSAALFYSDLEYGGGDANVICFGPKDIDPKAIQKDSIDIVFDLEKLKTNPCIFYKQRDLGYDPDRVGEVRIGKTGTLSFSHTKGLIMGKVGKVGCINLQLYGQYRGTYSELPNYYFIAYNVPEMHQILTLNFFRFLDTLKNLSDNSLAQTTINRVYAEIEKLDEKELIEFLTNLGQQMTDTAEFNFYGAYKIDFSAIQTIFSKLSSYTLKLPEFIKDLQSGDTEKLKEAREKIPTIFKSYRFLGYLISKIQNEKTQKQLLALRQACSSIPLWMKEIQKSGKKPGTSELEKQLLSKIDLIKSLQLDSDSKDRIETEILNIKNIKEQLSFTLESTLSTGKTVKEEIQNAIRGPFSDRVMELFKNPTSLFLSGCPSH